MQIHDRLRNTQCAVHNILRIKQLNDWLIVNTSSLYNDDVRRFTPYPNTKVITAL